ncbi:MAG TPA: hypothetical protein VGG28_25250 [Kofleriaceae bacterium]|jgi:hypothetical protein
MKLVVAVAALVVRLVDPDVAIHSATIYSITNDNSRFEVTLRTDSTHDQFPTLVIGDRTLKANGYGGDSTGTSVDLQVDRADAAAIAAALGVPLHDRARLDADIHYAWRFPTAIRNGAPAIVTLVATNTGTAPVGFQIGGRQRGPRDNRFTFTVARDGVALHVIDAPDFGGLSYFKRLGPGESAEVSADLRSWVALDRPGRYTITATHETDLSKAGEMPHYPDGAADVWTIAPTGQGAIVVR